MHKYNRDRFRDTKLGLKALAQATRRNEEISKVTQDYAKVSSSEMKQSEQRRADDRLLELP